MIDQIDEILINQIPFWLKHTILKYYICDLTPSDLISLYTHPFFIEILEQLSLKEWLQIYSNDKQMIISAGGYHSLIIKTNGKTVTWDDFSIDQLKNMQIFDCFHPLLLLA